MDNRPFAPGPTSKPNLPPKLEPQKPVHLRHWPKHLSLIILLILLAGVVYGGVWWLQQMQLANQGQNIYISTSTSTPTNQIIYRNDQYGFQILLPQSWQGYSVMTNQWEGRDVSTGKVTQTGPELVLRNPAWTSANPTEDMPVMVFTPEQWIQVQQEQLAVSAAPIPPSLLGQNTKYVLALPARYNYDFKTGWQEVDQLVHTLKAFEPTIASPTPASLNLIHCGGNIKNAPTCPSGYTCQLYISAPDTGGVCVKNQ